VVTLFVVVVHNGTHTKRHYCYLGLLHVAERTHRLYVDTNFAYVKLTSHT